MSPSPTIHAGYEQMIGAAAVDAGFKSTLLRDPRAAALRFGIAPADAEIVADIHATDLRAFASALLPRLYGSIAGRVEHASAVAG
ncbi:MAG TPA: hypothetical protein VNL71_13015 [Chloroflexota bacterium]|nr:hypothetical protein [Chloroflexota bacterium]